MPVDFDGGEMFDCAVIVIFGGIFYGLSVGGLDGYNGIAIGQRSVVGLIGLDL